MIPGKTMHNIAFVDRDYTEIYNKFISLGRNTKNGLGAHGNSYECADFYDSLLEDKDHLQKIKGEIYPSLKDDEEAINAILHLSSVTNGVLADRAYKNAEKRTGMPLTDISSDFKNVKLDFADLQSKPPRKCDLNPYYEIVSFPELSRNSKHHRV